MGAHMAMIPFEELDQQLERRFDRFVGHLRLDDPTAAAEEFARTCQWLRSSELRLPRRTMAAFMEGWVELFWQCRRHDLMLEAAEAAVQTFGPDPEWAFARGEALFNLGRFDDARETLSPLTHEDFDEPMVYYLLGCIAERRGETEDASRLFQAAHRLDPKTFRRPVPISEEKTLRLFETCIADLPEPVAHALKELPIFVSPLPRDDLIHQFNPPLDPLVMGVFFGQPRGEEPSSWPEDQPRIHLFHRNIAKLAADFPTLNEELRKTLFHEFGHYLGYDEDQLDQMGLA